MQFAVGTDAKASDTACVLGYIGLVQNDVKQWNRSI